jgi:hypothetical protein
METFSSASTIWMLLPLEYKLGKTIIGERLWVVIKSPIATIILPDTIPDDAIEEPAEYDAG